MASFKFGVGKGVGRRGEKGEKLQIRSPFSLRMFADGKGVKISSMLIFVRHGLIFSCHVLYLEEYVHCANIHAGPLSRVHVDGSSS